MHISILNKSNKHSYPSMTEDVDFILNELNNEKAKECLGGVVFVSVMMVLGVLGNVHVLYIYSTRKKPSNHRVFILVLAGLDLTVCAVGLPFVIADLRNPLTFTWTFACKAFRCVNYFLGSTAALLLLVIAVER